MTRRTDERGSITAFVVVTMVGLMACLALVVDGGRLVAARTRAADLAENAARVGAQEASGLRGGEAWVVDADRARSAAQQFLADRGASGSVVVSGRRVSVTVTIDQPLPLLGVFGDDSRMVTATRTAELADS